MIVLMGTHTLAQTTIQLPNPGWNNDRNANRKVQWKQSMNGTVYSYVDGTDEQGLRLDFLISEDKAEELIRFFKVYAATRNRMYDHNGHVWIFRFTRNDLTFTTQGGKESGSTQLSLKQVTLEMLATDIT